MKFTQACWRSAVSILALIGIIYGAVVALIQTDIKRLVAYSSVSHLGFVVLGIFAFTNQGVTGGILQMVNHGLSTGALFLLVGMVYERTHTRDLGKMGGLAVVMPILGHASWHLYRRTVEPAEGGNPPPR